MSETVHYTGKIKKLNLGDLTLKEQVKILRGRGFTIDDDDICDDGQFYCEKIVQVDDKLYEVLEKNDLDADGDIMEAKQENDGVISYQLRYYNGGCGFDEAIEHALRDMEI